jgi:hypothetical protein
VTGLFVGSYLEGVIVGTSALTGALSGASDPTGYSFSMTAGNTGGVAFGYARSGDSIGIGPFGSINAEPIPGQTLDDVLSLSGNSYVIFAGDQTALLTGLTVWVDSVGYGAGDGGDWAYDSDNDRTVVVWSSGGPVFADGVTYSIEIR